jgi:hypothetical protein
MNNIIDKKYGMPVEEISCPCCGRKYGHHKTKVDINSEECSKCATGNVELFTSKYFIETILGYIPYSF